METVIVRLWQWPPGSVRAGGVRGVARLVRTGEELPFSDIDELCAVMQRWSGAEEVVSDPST
jgi:hypothetical protein